jgi:septum formation protein
MMGLQGRFQVIPSPLKEEEVQVQYSTSLSPTEYTRRLAEEKAMALAHVLAYDPSSPLITSLLFSNGKLVPTLVLGSDTIVEWNGMILEKPKDVADARNMLLQLSGQQHQVHTGVALYLVMFGDISEHVVEPTTTPTTKTDTASTNSIRLLSSFTDTAWVQFAPLSQQDIEAYLATGEPMDKAGSYGIQGVGGQFVTNITGDFFTVMGLPAHRTSQALAKAMSDVLSSNV